MPLKAVLENVEDLDEVTRGLYKEADGRFILDVEGMVSEDEIESHEKTQGLKSALDKERQSRRDFEKKVKELESKTGDFTAEDLAELEELRDVKRKAEEERRRQTGEFDKWRDEINSEHAQTLAKKDEFISRLQETIRSDRVGRQIAEACAEHGAPTALMDAYIKQHVKSSFDDEGNLKIEIDHPDISGLDEQGQPISIGGFVKKLADHKEFGQYFASKQKSGAGTPPADRDGGKGGNPGETPGNEPDPATMTPSQKRMHDIRQKIDARKQAGAEG